MRIPTPDTRTVVLLLAAALALLVLGVVLKGVAYLLVLVAIGLAVYAFVAHRTDAGHG